MHILDVLFLVVFTESLFQRWHVLEIVMLNGHPELDSHLLSSTSFIGLLHDFVVVDSNFSLRSVDVESHVGSLLGSSNLGESALGHWIDCWGVVVVRRWCL